MEVLAKILFVHGPWTKKRKSKKLHKADVRVPCKKDPWYDSAGSGDLLNHVKDNQNHKSPQMTHKTKVDQDVSDGDDLLNGCGLTRERGSFKMALKRGLGEYNGRGFKDRTLVTHAHDYYHVIGGSSHDWMLLASLLDRLFFFVYFVINLIAASVIFTQAIP